jgi:hypothetical protein
VAGTREVASQVVVVVVVATTAVELQAARSAALATT